MTPEEILNKLKKISTEAFEHQVEKSTVNTSKKAGEIMDKIYYEPYVLSFNELCDVARAKGEAEFEQLEESLR